MAQYTLSYPTISASIQSLTADGIAHNSYVVRFDETQTESLREETIMHFSASSGVCYVALGTTASADTHTVKLENSDSFYTLHKGPISVAFSVNGSGSLNTTKTYRG